MYQGQSQDPAEGLTFTVDSTGYPQPWETEGRISHLFYDVDKGIDFTFNVGYAACPSAYARVSVRLKENGETVVTGFSYGPNDCVTHEGEPAVEIEQVETQCSVPYEWDGSILVVHFNDCLITNSQPDTSGRPVVTSVTLDGTITSELHKIYCD